MSKLNDMIDAIESEDFDEARSALKASLADYMAGKKYLSNRELFGDAYTNPNNAYKNIHEVYSVDEGQCCECMDCGTQFNSSQVEIEGQCPKCGSGDIDCQDCE